MKQFGTDKLQAYARWSVREPVIICQSRDEFYIGGKKVEIITKAKATCTPEDKFNEEFGKALSLVRCRCKANKRLEKLLIQHSNKREPIFNTAWEHTLKIPADIASHSLDKTILIIGKDMYKLERINNG